MWARVGCENPRQGSKVPADIITVAIMDIHEIILYKNDHYSYGRNFGVAWKKPEKSRLEKDSTKGGTLILHKKLRTYW